MKSKRFGVTHKEKLKIKTNVDVLTLTATPIPRTLHMSLLGVRDLSVIETPPENRFPIQTYVMEMNPGLVKRLLKESWPDTVKFTMFIIILMILTGKLKNYPCLYRMPDLFMRMEE